MKVEHSYDLIVIGDQLSGLFLAAGAAQRGEKVLVLEEASFPHVLYEVPSGKLLGDFLAEPVIGLSTGSPADKFLRTLGLYQELDQLFPLHDPPLQILSEGLRLDFPYQREALAAHLTQEISLKQGDREKLAQLLSGDFVTRKSFAAAVEELGLPVAFEQLGPLQSALYGSLLPDHFAYRDYRDLMRLCAHGVRYTLGGRGALKEKLLGRIQILGGAIRRNCRVEELVFERKRLAGVLLSSFEGFVRSERVVGALAAHRLVRLLPAAMRTGALQEAVGQMIPKAWKLGFTLLVPEEAIPEGLGGQAVLLDPELGLSEEGCVQLQVFPKNTYGGIPAGQRAVMGRVLVPYQEAFLKPAAIAMLLKRALLRVERVLPSLPRHSYSFFPDPDRIEQDPVFQRYYRFKDLSYIPGSILVFEQGFGEKYQVRERLDWTHFGLGGLALCSRDIRPLEGMAGEILAALELLSVWEPKKK